MRKTKIICTIGPSVSSDEIVRDLILSGMNAARFNFSHGTHESQKQQLERVKRVRDSMCAPIATILDTKGPEIRIKTFEISPVTLTRGQQFTLTTEDIAGTPERVSVTYSRLHEEVKPGNRILIDDGLIELAVKKISGCEIICEVENGGPVSNNKSINIPDIHICLPSLTDKDIDDIRFGVENGFDFIAASFVRSAEDVKNVRRTLDSFGGENVKIIAKVENREGVENFSAIVAEADGIMVARGDLGVEIPMFDVPSLQKSMIYECVQSGKPVITATQMLDSMIRNPRPTRAEVSDVANAVYDGTSCVMLSGETASGLYPVESVKTMAETLIAAEDSIEYWARFTKSQSSATGSINSAISEGCCMIARDIGAKAILAVTRSGYTARAISRCRPNCTIAAITTTEVVRRQLSITWGVRPFLTGSVDSTDRIFTMCTECALQHKLVEPGDNVVITAGIPSGHGSTNLIKAHTVTMPFEG